MRSSGRSATPHGVSAYSSSPASRRSGSTSARPATDASSSSSPRRSPAASGQSPAGPSWVGSACAILHGDRLARRPDDPETLAQQQAAPPVRVRGGRARVLGAVRRAVGGRGPVGRSAGARGRDRRDEAEGDTGGAPAKSGGAAWADRAGAARK